MKGRAERGLLHFNNEVFFFKKSETDLVHG
jgi:hypothetical protein